MLIVNRDSPNDHFAFAASQMSVPKTQFQVSKGFAAITRWNIVADQVAFDSTNDLLLSAAALLFRDVLLPF